MTDTHLRILTTVARHSRRRLEPPIERLPRLAESAVAAATRPAGTETSVVVIV